MPLPEWLPGGSAVGQLMGFVLFLSGASLFVLPDTRSSLICVSAVLASWIVVLHPSRLLAGQFSLGAWLGIAEVGAVAVACWLLSRQPRDHEVQNEVDQWQAKVASALYGAALIVFGLCHFAYLEITTSMVPHWMPARTALAMLTGVGHIAASAALLSGLLAGVATRLLAMMFATFVLLVHVPRVGADPTNRDEWLLLCASVLLTASACIMASIVARRSDVETSPFQFLTRRSRRFDEAETSRQDARLTDGPDK